MGFSTDLSKNISSRPTLTLLGLTIGVNVITMAILVLVSLVLHLQLEAMRSQDGQPSGHDDVTKTIDVTASSDVGENRDSINRYCYKEDPKVCQERGHSVKNVTASGEPVCCGHLGDHLYDIMNEAVHERLETDAIRGGMMQAIKNYIKRVNHDSSAATFRPAAHVGILQNGNLTGPDNTVPRVQWAKSGEGSFLTGDIIHKGDRLVVTTPGFYYVYTGLQFNVDPSRTTEPIVAFLFRTINDSEEGRQKLMASRDSSCRQTRGNSVAGPITTHMAGIFLLRQNDEVSVRTYSQSLLSRSPATTYFGLHMV
ncbi:hypothetical protein ACOMHN_024286 [Nucella lapillus]